MANYPRLILQLVATIGVAVMLSTPASAAEIAIPKAAAAKTARPVIKRLVSRGTRIAASHYDRHVSAIRRDLGCAGEWCGRQFVLMIGIGY
jgi:hypothetical protein